MNPGSLNQRIVIQRPASGVDASGQPLATWSAVATVWADVRYQSGVEAMKADAVASVAKASIRIRYRTDIAIGMRAVQGAVVYSIAAVLPDMARKEYIDLVCEVLA